LAGAQVRGVTIVIGADAHNIAGLANVDFGVGIARKGCLGPDAILSCRDSEGSFAFARARRAAP
jgi:histidinol phosphatase-like PHP family hydrolase